MFSESFSGEGFSHIINNQGEFILKAENKNSKAKGINFFDNLKTMEKNTRSLNELEKDILEDKVGNIKFELESVKFTLNYMPLKNGNWYVLSMFQVKYIHHSYLTIQDIIWQLYLFLCLYF